MLNQSAINGKIREKSDLSKTTWFRVGGFADYSFTPDNIESLSQFVKQHNDSQIVPLGCGSNIIVRDKGIRGYVIKLGRNFTNIDIENNIATIGAAALDYNVAQFLAQKGLANLEFLIGIPGSIGGAIEMNAGAYGSETANHFIDCQAVRISDGKIFTFTNKEMGYKYRSHSLEEKFIFTSARFKLENKSPDEIISKMQTIIRNRQESQPIKERTSGSTFKNPQNNKKAWELIDEAGLRGFKIGDAQISEKHCNFMINTGNAKAADLENLGNYIIEKVYQKTGIRLEWEIRRIGEK